MSLLSIVVFIIILLVTTTKTETRQDPSATSTNIRNYFYNMVNNQSQKVLHIFDTIQTKAKTMLTRLKSLERSRMHGIEESKEKQQIEAPDVKKWIDKRALDAIKTARSHSNQNSHYSTGYGHTGPSNHGGGGSATFHHHSIGFDPINIVLSMSLLSFILQLLQGLLNRTTMLPQVVQARTSAGVQDFWQAIENKYGKPGRSQKYLKKKYYKFLMNKE